MLGLLRETDGAGGQALREIEEHSGQIQSRVVEAMREPDSGDLLAMLARVPDGIATRALIDLGVDDAALDAALARARAAGPEPRDESLAQVRERLGIGSRV
jgi:hypothetical protein